MTTDGELQVGPDVELDPEAMRTRDIKNILSTGKDDYNTPPEIIRYWEARLRIKQFFDPCPNNPRWDGLKIDWRDENFVNPPYSHPAMDQFILKAVEEARKGSRSVFIIPPKTDKKIFHDLIWKNASHIILLRGRVSFIDPSTGRRVGGNTRGSMFVIFERMRFNAPRVEVLDITAFEAFK